MITIINRQRSYLIKPANLKKAAHAMLAELGLERFSCSILICSPQAMQKLNAEHRGKDKPTDVLSFPSHPHGLPKQPKTSEDRYLGDIAFCPHYIDKKRHDWNHTMHEHYLFLLAHAIAHLIGHDHETEADHAAMQVVEKQLLAALAHLHF